MSDITDLAEIIRQGMVNAEEWGMDHRDIAADIIAAGFHRDRTITTAEELDALPIGAVIRDSEGEVFEQWATGDWQAVGSLDTGESRLPSEAVFPVTVLYEGARDE